MSGRHGVGAPPVAELFTDRQSQRLVPDTGSRVGGAGTGQSDGAQGEPLTAILPYTLTLADNHHGRSSSWTRLSPWVARVTAT